MKTDFLFSVTPGGVWNQKSVFIHPGGVSENGGGGADWKRYTAMRQTEHENEKDLTQVDASLIRKWQYVGICKINWLNTQERPAKIVTVNATKGSNKWASSKNRYFVILDIHRLAKFQIPYK